MNSVFHKTVLLCGLAILAGFLVVEFVSQGTQTQASILTAMAVTGLVAVIIKKILINPVLDAKRIARNIASKDFSESFPVTGLDDLSQLSRELNQILASFKHQISEHTDDRQEINTILSSMVEGVVVIGKGDSILVLTNPIIEMLELRSPTAIGKPYWEVIRHEEINSLIRESLEEKKAVRKEIILQTPQESFFSMQISPIIGEDHLLLGVVVVFHDITDLKRLEKIRTEFVANASHELKTPLTSIKGFVETLLDTDLNDRPTVRKFLEIIQKHSRRLENLINDLLSLSVIESGEAKFSFEPANLTGMLDGCFHLFKSKLDQKNHKFRLDVPDRSLMVQVDKEKIEEVFSNLLDNAIKFTPDKGEILIRAELEEDYVRVDFKDNGIGIPPEHLSSIFERFYRVDKARSREMGGTGLGLAIVKHTVLRHNGKVTVQSEPEKGSTFSVYLPRIFPSQT